MNSSDLRLDWLRSFLAFAERGSFTAAARDLHLSQPALFTQIRHLGESVGRPLYVKVGRTLSLTEAGREVEALARAVLGPIDDFSRRLAGGEPLPPVVSAGRATQLYVLAGPLRSWGRPLSLRTEDREATLDSVRRGRADLGLAPMVELDPDLRCDPVLELGSVAVLPEGDPLAGAVSLPARALAGRPLVLPPRGRPHREAVVTALGAPPQVVIEVDGWELMAHYASLGVGVAIVSELIPMPPGAVAVPVVDLPKQRFHLIRRRERAPGVEALAEHVLEGLARASVGRPQM